METGIIGLPKSGKTTVFNALTRGKADTAAYSLSEGLNIGVAKVPDVRLQKLESMFHPRRVVHAEIKYVDVAAFPKGFGKGEGISGKLLTHLSRADALMLVVRAFMDDGVPHVENTVDPARDVVTFGMELAFSDLAIQERRLERIVSSLKGARSVEREQLLREQGLLDRVKAALERETPVRGQGLSPDELKLISNYQFLTAKPLLIVLNIGEDQLPRSQAMEEEARHHCSGPDCDVLSVCGKLEMELSRLNEEEAEAFRESMGAGQSALEKVIRASYRLLGLASFFTVGPDEVRAWTVARDTPAQRAAGKVHSDMEKGFIRAEVVSYEDLVRCGSLAEARRHGLLRLEGKGYPVRDGDVINFLFSV